MGQGIWIDSEKLNPNDTIGEVLKHGTLSVGFIGLAECLKALIGVHHGESKEAQELGLRIIGRMRARMDEESKKTGLNFSLLATPAEGLSGRFVKIDRQEVRQNRGRNRQRILHELIPYTCLLPHQRIQKNQAGSALSRTHKRRSYQLCRA